MPQATPPVTPDKGPGPWALALALALHPGHTSDLGGPRVELWATQPPPLGPVSTITPWVSQASGISFPQPCWDDS